MSIVNQDMVPSSQKWWVRGSRQTTWEIVKKFEDVKLQALLDEDDLETQKQLVKEFDVSQQN